MAHRRRGGADTNRVARRHHRHGPHHCLRTGTAQCRLRRHLESRQQHLPRQGLRRALPHDSGRHRRLLHRRLPRGRGRHGLLPDRRALPGRRRRQLPPLHPLHDEPQARIRPHGTRRQDSARKTRRSGRRQHHRSRAGCPHPRRRRGGKRRVQPRHRRPHRRVNAPRRSPRRQSPERQRQHQRRAQSPHHRPLRAIHRRPRPPPHRNRRERQGPHRTLHHPLCPPVHPRRRRPGRIALRAAAPAGCRHMAYSSSSPAPAPW